MKSCGFGPRPIPPLQTESHETANGGRLNPQGRPIVWPVVASSPPRLRLYTALIDMAYTIAGFQRGELDAIQRKLREAAIAQSTDSLLPRAASAGVVRASTPSRRRSARRRS